MPLQTIPTLTTERLFLRPPVVGDFPAYALLLSSPRANYMGGPYAQRAAWGLFCHDVACWELFGHGGLMIDLRTTGECVGQVGINHGPLFPEKELGWQLYEGHEGRGYATEAAMAMRLRCGAFAAIARASIILWESRPIRRTARFGSPTGATTPPSLLIAEPMAMPRQGASSAALPREHPRPGLGIPWRSPTIPSATRFSSPIE